MTLTLPTIVSCVRILLAPLVYLLIVSESSSAWQWAAIVFFIGGISDYADGWLARKRGEVTSFGVFFDPLADKILVSAAFFGFAEAEVLPLWPVLIIIVRDVITTLLRSYADDIGHPVITSRSAKAKTFLQMCFIVWLIGLAWLGSAKFSFSNELRHLLYSEYTYYGIIALTGYTVWTGIEYLWVNRHAVRRFISIDCAEYSSEWIVTGFGIGHAPFMPGTFGSLAALGLTLFTQSHEIFFLLAIIGIIIGLLAIPNTERKYGSDSSIIIIDECVGIWIILAWPYVPIDIFWCIVGFALFRLFDVLKPPPISWANRKNGAYWVIFDDVLAAFAVILILHCLYISAMFFPLVKAFLFK